MTKVWPHPIYAIVFDNDGLLLDTEPLYAIIHEKLTGHHLDWDFRRKLMGRTGPSACELIVKEYNMPYTWQEYIKIRDEELKKIFPTSKLFPGAKELLDEVVRRKIPRALATSSNRDNFVTKIVHHKEFFDQFDCITCGDEVSAGKPNPEIFLTSMKKLGFINPENILVFEDAPLGVKGANNAGMPVVMIPDPELPMPLSIEEVDAHPTIILKSIKDFDFNAFEWGTPEQK